MAEPDPVDTALYREIGEIKAIAREAKHAANNASHKIDAVAGKVDALALVVAAQGQLRDIVERLERHSGEQDVEIDLLKADKLRREGALGLVNWFARNWPITLVLMVLGVLIAWANGKLG